MCKYDRKVQKIHTYEIKIYKIVKKAFFKNFLANRIQNGLNVTKMEFFSM